jgi:hypothetical protein
MAFYYRTSDALLSEIWRVLRTPVTPSGTALAQHAVKECFSLVRYRRGEPFHTCVESILTCVAGNAEISSAARAKLVAMLQVPNRRSLSRLDDYGDATDFADLPLPKIADFCLRLEMLGFDIDSEPMCKLAWPDPDSIPVKALEAYGIETISLKERHKNQVVVTAHNGRPHRAIHTLRTYRGFIIQAYLDRSLNPVRLDVFGPKYNAVGDWMDLLSGDVAWSLELRDAPGYDHRALLQKSYRAATWTA